MKIKILSIRPKPKWKFWKIDNWEVTVLIDNRIVKTVTIFDEPPIIKESFLKYVKNKVLYGKQWLNQLFPKKGLAELIELIGTEIDTEKEAKEVG